jgi:hypothetical protein
MTDKHTHKFATGFLSVSGLMGWLVQQSIKLMLAFASKLILGFG